MCWRRPAWTPVAAMSPCRGTATAWTCIMARTIFQSRPAHPHFVARSGQGHGVRLPTRRSSTELCRATGDHLPRARGRDRAQGRAGKGPQHVRQPAPVRRSRARARKGGSTPKSVAPTRETAEDREAALRKARTDALKRHARAVDAIFSAEDAGGKASPEQVKELQEARKVFEQVRPYGSHDAEAAYKKNPELVSEAADGQVNRAIRALQLETELRADPEPPGRSFRGTLAEARPDQPAPVSGGRHVRLQGHALGDGRHGEEPRTRSATGIHPCQPQEGSRHRDRTQVAGSASNSPSATASTSVEAGASGISSHPICRRLCATLRQVEKTLLPSCNSLSCLVSEAVRNHQQEAARPCAKTVSSV